MKTPALDAMCDHFNMSAFTSENRRTEAGADCRWQAMLRVDEGSCDDVVYAYAPTRKRALRSLECDVAKKLSAAAKQASCPKAD